MTRLLPLALICGCMPQLPYSGWTWDSDQPGLEDSGADSSDGGSSDSGPSDSGPSDTGPEPLPVFELQANTDLDARGVMELHSNLPFLVADCQVLEVQDAPCDDQDQDGLVDAWEDLALQRLMPIVRFDEGEPMFGDGAAVFSAVGRVALAVGRADRIQVYVMLGYSQDYGRCVLDAHAGDSERVVLELAPIAAGLPGSVRVNNAYTAGHEGTDVDSSQTFRGDELTVLETVADPTTSEPRWMVYASEGKHATYATAQICEDRSWVLCLEEDCDSDGADPSGFTVLPPVVNAGEDHARLLDDLSQVGFPEDSAWADQDFCGGQGRTWPCSSSVRSKLMVDPFG